MIMIIFLKDWKKCHALLFKTGKQNILRRVAAFDPKDTNPTIVAAAQKILSPFKYLQIRDVSKGAAAFFTWVSDDTMLLFTSTFR